MAHVKLLLTLVALAGAGWAAVTWLPQALESGVVAAAVPPEGLYAAHRGTLKVTLVENGTLVAKESRKVDCDLRGDAKITWIVEEGAQVEEGEVLCRLDESEMTERLETQELEIVQAQASLESAQTDLEIQEADNASNIEKAEVALEKAVKELERYREGDAPKERRNLEIAISEAQTNFTRAKKKYEDSAMLLEKDYINRSQFEEDEIAYKRTEVQLEGAKRDMELFEAYTFPMTLKEKQLAVNEATRNEDTTAKRAESSLRNKEVQVEQYKSRLAKLEKRRDELAEQIEKMTLVAPSPGIVIYGDPRQPWYRENIRVGGEVWGSMTVITLPDLRVMQVKLRVHEADISKLQNDQRVNVTMDTYPGLVIPGTVTKIASIASGDNPWEQDPEVKKFDVEVTLQSEDLGIELKPGISAKAEIFIAEKADVLQVPIQCVFLEDGQQYAYVLGADGRPEAAPVETGLANETFIEVTSGLDDGRQVLLYNPNLPGAGEDLDDEEAVGGGAGGADEGDDADDGGGDDGEAALP